MVRLIFSDLDDTFLSADKTIPDANRALLEEASRQDIQFVPCTGRNINGIPASIAEYGCVHYAVCCNGALVADLDRGEVIHEVDIEKEEVRRLFRALEGLPITFDLFADGHVLTAEDRWRFLDEIPVTEPTRIHIKEVRTCYPGSVEDMIDAAKNICRINIFYLDNDTRDRVWEVVDSFSDLIRASSQPCNVEVTKNGADKGAGLLWLADHLGVPVEETVAFGDSSNDIAMLKAAGDGVAVANARPECLAAAEHIAQSNDKGGVGLYMEELLRRQ
ncbi:MAG: HAD family hydrolase [Atopobiaceae bacterium]|nr:HAD family hydrolase [Atopobiaceae bacterium]